MSQFLNYFGQVFSHFINIFEIHMRMYTTKISGVQEGLSAASKQERVANVK